MVVGLVCGLVGVCLCFLIYYGKHVKLFVVFECVWARLGYAGLCGCDLAVCFLRFLFLSLTSSFVNHMYAHMLFGLCGSNSSSRSSSSMWLFLL